MAPQERNADLDVYLLGVRVGRIDYASHHNEMHFTYDTDYLSQAEATPLSFSLPLQSEPFDSDRTTVFFENLLPPDQVRRKLGPVLHLSRHNLFGFLEALGGDCAGAISLWPHGTKPAESEERVRELTDDEADAILRSLKKRPLYVNGVDGYRISGAGAQNKLIVRFEAGRISLPLFGTPSTHILKPASEGGPSFAVCMEAMGQMGIALADRFAFIDRMIFNFLIGNADAHGKNSSVLYRGRDRKSLAPIYDVMCTAVYRNLSRVNAMSIGGARTFDEVTRQNFSKMAEEVGMRPQLVLGRLDRLAHRIIPAAQKLVSSMNAEWPSEVYAKIVALIGNQVQLVAS